MIINGKKLSIIFASFYIVNIIVVNALIIVFSVANNFSIEVLKAIPFTGISVFVSVTSTFIISVLAYLINKKDINEIKIKGVENEKNNIYNSNPLFPDININELPNNSKK